MSNYTRVLPRDLFNEAKLLKCLGQLCLLIHDEMIALNVRHDKRKVRGFDIQQDSSDGSIYAKNLVFYTASGVTIEFRSPINSRESYPLFAVLDRGNLDVYLQVFDDNGSITPELREWLESNK